MNRENVTNPAATRSIPGFVSNGKCKTRIAAQGITTFLDFACCRRPFFGIIDCNQNSHSRPGKTRGCRFWLEKWQHHRSIRQFKFNMVSGNASKPMDVQRFGFAERLEACIDRQPIILRRCCGRRMLEDAECCASPKDLLQNRRATGCDFCDFISIELASFVDIVTDRFQGLMRILDEFEQLSVVPQSVLGFVVSHSSPKFAIWCSKNRGFVVFAMPPKTPLCCGRRPRSIHQGVVVAADLGSDPQIGRIRGMPP